MAAMDEQAAPSSKPVVRVAGVSKTFGDDGARVTALEGIDLAIRSGEFVSLIGPSGCGKSTLLRLIGDLTSPTTGSIEVNGIAVSPRDGVAIADLDTVRITATDEAEIVLVDVA